MTLRELYKNLCSLYPESDAAPWDNDGIACLPDPAREVTRVLIALDATPAAVEEAISTGAQLLLTHHPLIFHPLKGLDPASEPARLLLRLARADVALFSLHTRFDAARDGVNDALAEVLNLEEVQPFEVEDLPIGRVGDLPASMTVWVLADELARDTPASHVDYFRAVGHGDRERDPSLISRIAVCGGKGDDAVDGALAAGAQALVTGEMGYHNATAAARRGLSVLLCGHYASEFPGLATLADVLRKMGISSPAVYFESGLLPSCLLAPAEDEE